MEKKGKIIIISAPSGCGKSTIIRNIIDDPNLNLGFSISATSRTPREGECDGKDYYFITNEEFMQRVNNGEFIEWEEVYPGTCYGTLASEVERLTNSGRNLILDIDVRGGVNVKQRFGDKALALFIMPPSIEVLTQRLRQRATDSGNKIAQRLAKADYEMSFAPQYDTTIVNDNLEIAINQVRNTISDFIIQ